MPQIGPRARKGLETEQATEQAFGAKFEKRGLRNISVVWSGLSSQQPRAKMSEEGSQRMHCKMAYLLRISSLIVLILLMLYLLKINLSCGGDRVREVVSFNNRPRRCSSVWTKIYTKKSNPPSPRWFLGRFVFYDTTLDLCLHCNDDSLCAACCGVHFFAESNFLFPSFLKVPIPFSCCYHTDLVMIQCLTHITVILSFLVFIHIFWLTGQLAPLPTQPALLSNHVTPCVCTTPPFYLSS